MSDVTADLVNEVQERTTAAKEKGTFNFTDVLNKRSYPTARVVVYLDVASIVKLAKINERLTKLAQSRENNDAEYEKYERLADKVKGAVLASALTIHLRGLDSGVVKALQTKAQGTEDMDDDEKETFYFQLLTSQSITKIEDAEGNVDQREFTIEDVAALQNTLPPEQFSLLDQKVGELTFETSFFEAAVDAGFLPTS